MEFECKEIRVSYEELGCTVTFSDTPDKGYIENQSVEEIMNSNEKYLLLQRTYPEDEFEKDDFCYIETNDFETSGHYSEFKMELDENEINVNWEDNEVRVGLKMNVEEYKKLISALRIITKQTGNLKIKQ